MLFKDFVELYSKDCSQRIKPNTLQTKEYIIESKILPYFKRKSMKLNVGYY